jgi:hypothetical protein
MMHECGVAERPLVLMQWPFSSAVRGYTIPSCISNAELWTVPAAAYREDGYEKRWEGKQIENHPKPTRHITQFNALIINSFESGSLSVQLERHASSHILRIPTVLIYEHDTGVNQKLIFRTIIKDGERLNAVCCILHNWIPQFIRNWLRMTKQCSNNFDSVQVTLMPFGRACAGRTMLSVLVRTSRHGMRWDLYDS